jgi:nucleotide-binding universal stress UspA family protein
LTLYKALKPVNLIYGVTVYKTIFVPVTSEGDQSPALNFSVAIAQSFGAKAECLFASKSLVFLEKSKNEKIIQVHHNEGHIASQALAEKFYKEQFHERALKVKEWFYKKVSELQADDTLVWKEPLDVFGENSEQIVENFTYHDLTVASFDLSTSVINSVIDDALFSTGRPLAMISRFASGKKLEETTVIIAWKNSPQTVRALWFALPFLQKAKKLIVMNVKEDKSNGNLHHIVEYLKRHNIRLETKVIDNSQNPALSLEKLYKEEKADLLVMGAYSHTRLREMVFGGFTKHFLNSGNCNLFLSH